ncbi:MAG TPA: metallophosphoesterase [Anaerolineaceae bacterium]|nr:metallophosphoesterase [Anaerolineaceae bacterium]
MRVAAIADIHCRANTPELIPQILEGVGDAADVLLLAGDLTDTGLPDEAECLVEQLQKIDMPKIGILGNHDHESGHPEEIKKVLKEGGITVLDGTLHEIGEVGFVGTKGFCGGFGENLVQPFGEAALKDFIRTGIDEAMTLENALAKLSCKHKVAILHYAPVKDTLIGEPPELFPFLGSSRLANAIDRRGVDVIVHGHAHHGSPSGKTAGNIPVHNVSRYVQFKNFQRCYCVFDL